MNKKKMMMSAVALVTASALAFGPVSFKVVDKVYASDAVVLSVGDRLDGVLAAVKSDDVLKDAVNKAITAANANIGLLDITNLLPKLSASVSVQYGSTSELEAIFDAVVTELINQLDNGVNETSGSDLAELKAAVNEANELFETEITTSDVRSFVSQVKNQVLENNLFDLTSSDLFDVVFDNIGDVVEEQWGQEDANPVVALIEQIYGTENKEDLTSDISNAIEELRAETYANANDKRDLKYGALALGLGYAKYELEKNAELTKVNANQFEVTGLSLLGNKALAGQLAWTVSVGNGDPTPQGVAQGKAIVNLAGKAGNKFTLTAVLPDIPSLVPAQFANVKVFEVEYTVDRSSASSGGSGTIITPMELSPDVEKVNSALEEKAKEILKGATSLDSNAAIQELKAALENELRSALTISARSNVTVVNGVSTLAVTTTDLDRILNDKLNAIINKANEVFGAATGGQKLQPVIIFDLGNATNSKLDLSSEVIAKLEENGISAVGVKVGGAIVEAPLSHLSGATSVLVKRTVADADGLHAGAKQLSNIYSIEILDADGNEISAFPGQYRLAIQANVNNSVDTSRLTLAKLTAGSLTFVGGNYNSETRDVVAYRSGFSEYVVIENKVAFDDTAEIKWAANEINVVASKGIIVGKADGVFDPRANVTRAEFTAMIVRALGVESDIHSEGFDDVSDEAWYQSVVASATANKIISGRTSTTFDPNASITREEMATITGNALQSVLGYKAANIENALAKFTDSSSIANAHKAGIALVAQEGIVQGKGEGVYDPKGTATRAEAAVIIAKLIELRK